MTNMEVTPTVSSGGRPREQDRGGDLRVHRRQGVCATRWMGFAGGKVCLRQLCQQQPESQLGSPERLRQTRKTARMATGRFTVDS